MKKCRFCAEEIKDEAIVCKHCGRDLVNQDTAQKVQIVAPKKNDSAYWLWFLALVGIVAVGAIINSIVNPPEPDRPLSAEQIAAVDKAFDDQGLRPVSLEKRGSFVVADFVLTDEQASGMPVSFKTFGQQRLLLIREALLPYGLRDFRVNVNGTPPGTGLVKRYGSARLIDGGTVEWLTP